MLKGGAGSQVDMHFACPSGLFVKDSTTSKDCIIYKLFLNSLYKPFAD